MEKSSAIGVAFFFRGHNTRTRFFQKKDAPRGLPKGRPHGASTRPHTNIIQIFIHLLKCFLHSSLASQSANYNWPSSQSRVQIITRPHTNIIQIFIHLHKLHSAKGLALGLQPCVEQSEQEQEQEQVLSPQFARKPECKL